MFSTGLSVRTKQLEKLNSALRISFGILLSADCITLCFYAVGALLVKNGVTTTTHAGSQQKFGELFILTGLIPKEMGKVYRKLFDKRQKGDYDDFFDFDEASVVEHLQPATDFVVEIEKLINK